MPLPESTQQATDLHQTLTEFIRRTRRYWRFDHQHDLTAAMEARAELMQSGEFTSDFLDGLSYGLKLPGYASASRDDLLL